MILKEKLSNWCDRNEPLFHCSKELLYEQKIQIAAVWATLTFDLHFDIFAAFNWNNPEDFGDKYESGFYFD